MTTKSDSIQAFIRVIEAFGLIGKIPLTEEAEFVSRGWPEHIAAANRRELFVLFINK